jgi:hypothetical protein
LKIVQRWGRGIHMNRWRVGEDRGSKETDGCPLTLADIKIGALYRTIGSRVVSADPYVIEMIAL